MSTTTERKQRTITLTGRQPVRIYDDEWAIIAEGQHKDWDNQYEFQANRKWNGWIKVRQHHDGRTIVYGCDTYVTHFQGENGYRYCGGVVLAPPGGAIIKDDEWYIWPEIPVAIIDLAEDLIARGAGEYMRQVAHECIADLPAEEL